MSSTLTIYCDRCNAVIHEGRTLLRVEAGPMRRYRETLDVCRLSAEQLLGWLRAESRAAAPANA